MSLHVVITQYAEIYLDICDRIWEKGALRAKR